MYHPTTRVLTILELLQARASMSGAELAARLEVDRRTVRRYITMLQDLGIPIEATRGPTGKYYLRPGFKLPPLMLTDDEALAITLSLVTARRIGIPAGMHALEGALAKIERVLPEQLRAQIQAVQSSVAYHPAQPTPQPSSELVLLLSAAVHDRRQVQIQYQTRDETSVRVVDPYGLVLHWEVWYLAGWCHLRQAIRVFRLDRIVAATSVDTTFERPTDFDSLLFTLEALATVPAGRAVEIFLGTTLDFARERIPPGVAVFEQTEGGVIMRGYSTDFAWLAKKLIALDVPVVIRHPPELRDAMRSLADVASAMAGHPTNNEV